MLFIGARLSVGHMREQSSDELCIQRRDFAVNQQNRITLKKNKKKNRPILKVREIVELNSKNKTSCI